MRFLLLLYLLVEFYFSLKVWGDIGFIYSILWIFFSMMLGFKILNLSSSTLAQGVESLNSGKLTFSGFKSLSFSYMVGGFLLILPGVFTDSIGLCLLFYAFYLQTIAKITPEQKNRTYSNKGNEDENIIDVEIIDERDSSNHLS